MKTIVWFVLVLSALSAEGKVYQGQLGKKVTLQCGLSARKSVRWDHGKEPVLTQDLKRGFLRKGTVDLTLRSRISGDNLVITVLKKEDVGQFTCTGDDKSQEHTLFMLLVSVSPSTELVLGSKATLQCEVNGLTGQGQWQRPNGVMSTSSEVNIDSVTQSDAGTWVCMFTHAGQTYKEEITIKVKGPTTTPTPTTTTKSPKAKGVVPAGGGGDRPLLGLSWWMWVAAGVGGLVVIFLMVSVVVLYKRIQRRKKRILKMKNGRPLKPRQYCQCDRPTAAAKAKQGRGREKASAPPPLLMV